MTRRMMYVTDDGMVFENETDALEHENEMRMETIREAVETLRSFCAENNNCSECMLRENCERHWCSCPCDWNF